MRLRILRKTHERSLPPVRVLNHRLLLRACWTCPGSWHSDLIALPFQEELGESPSVEVRGFVIVDGQRSGCCGTSHACHDYALGVVAHTGCAIQCSRCGDLLLTFREAPGHIGSRRRNDLAFEVGHQMPTKFPSDLPPRCHIYATMSQQSTEVLGLNDQ